MNSPKCEICNIDVHRASYVKHLGSKKHLKNEKQNEMIIPDWLFQEPIENKIKETYSPKSLKQIARVNNNLDDKQMNKDLAKNKIYLYFFTDRNLKVGFKINLDSYHINHATSNLTNIPNYPEFGIEVRYNKKIVRKLSVNYARIKNQNIFKYQRVFWQHLINNMKTIK